MNNKFLTVFVVLTLSILLNGCIPPVHTISSSTINPTHMQDFTLAGRIAFNAPPQNWLANFNWDQHKTDYVISFYGPLGLEAHQLIAKDGVVTLQMPGGKAYSATSPEKLLYQNTGMRIPVSDLVFWIKGVPSPRVAFKAERNNAQGITRLEQAGWTIDYLQYKKFGTLNLPVKLFLQIKNIKLKIIVTQWHF